MAFFIGLLAGVSGYVQDVKVRQTSTYSVIKSRVRTACIAQKPNHYYIFSLALQPRFYLISNYRDRRGLRCLCPRYPPSAITSS